MVTSAKVETASDIIGDIVQICCVTRDHRRTMNNLLKLGIGPWRIYNFNPDTTSDTRYKGKAHTFSAVMGYASSANTQFEVVEPTGGTSIFADLLEQRGEGVHHFGIENSNISVPNAIAVYSQRGFSVAQSGRVWSGDTAFTFIDTFGELGYYLELTESSPGFSPPEPDEWYPSRPSEGRTS